MAFNPYAEDGEVGNFDNGYAESTPETVIPIPYFFFHCFLIAIVWWSVLPLSLARPFAKREAEQEYH